MMQISKRWFVNNGLLAVVIAAIVLVAAGFWVCNSLSIAFDHLHRVQFTRLKAQSALALQVREDVELQEYARIQDRVFYDPQLGAFASSELRRAKVAAATCCGHKADRPFSDAQKAVTMWKEQVAGPLIAFPRSAFTPRSVITATYGKVLMDQYSGDLIEIDSILDVEARDAASDVQHAINSIVCIFAGLVVVFGLAAVCSRFVEASSAKPT